MGAGPGEASPVGATIDVVGVAQRLRKAMDVAGLSKAALALKSGVSKTTIGRALGRHEVSRGNLMVLADHLRVPPSWLIEGEGELNPEWIRPRPLGPQPDGTFVAQGPAMPIFPEDKAAAETQSAEIAKLFDRQVSLSSLRSAVALAERAADMNGKRPPATLVFDAAVRILDLLDEAGPPGRMPPEEVGRRLGEILAPLLAAT